MSLNNNKHIFAIFLSNNFFTETLQEKDKLILKNKDVVTRIIKILRLAVFDELILFDNVFAYKAEILDFDKNNFVVVRLINRLEPKPASQISIHLFLPILKKPAFEDALYFAAEIGINEITPVVFKKCYDWVKEKDASRLEKIIVSAKEQAKNFKPIKLNTKISFEKIELNKITKPVFCDPEGNALLKIKERLLLENEKTELSLFIGPEAGFTQEEIYLFEKNNFAKLRLGENILRADHAVLLAAGLLSNV